MTGRNIPSLTPEQRREALEKAHAVRSARRSFKGEVGTGRLGIASAIAMARADQALQGIRVKDLLMCLPGIGPKTAEQIMADADIAPARRIKGLGAHQASALIERLTS